MPPVNWNVFEGLPGGAQLNFEMLCRSLIHRHYGRYGDFAALATQPGVEFHLKLHTMCVLGDPGRWYGWQCRWYDLPGGRALGTTRRRKITKAIAITEKKLPGVTDWVLWTRRPLTEGDQEWFYGLNTHMRLHLWTAADVEEDLSGDAEILRATYFGELVLTPDTLASLHEVTVAPIRRRWQPEVHQTIDAERVLRRMLAETDTWDDLLKVGDQLNADIEAADADYQSLSGSIADATRRLIELARAFAITLSDTHAGLSRGDLDLLRQLLANRPGLPEPTLATLPTQLRASRRPAALTVTNALAETRRAAALLDEVDTYLGMRLTAILADAGCGKTELAAQLTAAISNRPAGILLYGRDLHAGHSLDDLARRVVIQGTPAPSMEALVAAVDAAGQRSQRRLPIVIDGLNEAEDPRDWKGPLASLHTTLRQYPYVLVVCTVRTAFAGEALPPNVDRLEVPDFGHDTPEAIHRYFAHYRVNPADAALPLGLLSHPLTLRLFCEVTNPTREQVVGIEAMPGSLTNLFERYLKQAAERIAELAPRTRRYYEQDVRSALDEIGINLWEQRTRGLGEHELRRRLGDDARMWNESIIRALEQEGVVLRVPGETSGAIRVTAIYDALAGHLVADAIVRRFGGAGFEGWLRDPVTVGALAGQPHDQHPLAADTIRALVGLVPRRLHRQQLWPLLDEPLRTDALRRAADLEGGYLDAQTIDALTTLAAEPPPPHARDLFDRLRQTRGVPSHPLNAEFLDAILRSMGVAQRDLRWTEWVRRHRDELLPDLERLENRWRNRTRRPAAERLRARWVMWTLASTDRELRDHATRTLYWFGRGDPSALFELTLEALAFNDPYVPERLLAASFGVVMAHQLHDQGFADALSPYLTGLRDAFTGLSATYPTNHRLARLYVQSTVTLARTYHNDAVPGGLEVKGSVPFANGPPIDPIASDDPRAAEVDQTLHMDFENYTLGRLFDDRANYDMSHPGHQAAVAHVRGTVWNFGWRKVGLGVVDEQLTWGAARHDRAQIERYGKKYGWIGFYTYAGILDDRRQLRTDDERLSDVQIDPSFPVRPQPAPIRVPAWARPTPKDDQSWIQNGTITVPDELLYSVDIGPYPGPWIAVEADLDTKGLAVGRRVFGFLTALLVGAADAERIMDALNRRGHPGSWRLPDVPSDYYTFAGEIPWSPEFARWGGSGNWAQLYRSDVRVGEGLPIEVEILAHRYAWETYHSVLNEAGGASVPSRSFSAAFDLRGVPQSFGQVLPDGTAAALSLGAPDGLVGNTLYLREDLLYWYAAGRRLIWFIWGERLLYPHTYPEPSWLGRARQNAANVWRRVRRGEELSRAFASRPAPRTRASKRRPPTRR